MPHKVAAHSQRLAAHPSHSAWVAASAGSGKTKVLTDRVLNLLLEGCSPERILCLTFTKAAAAEMSNRLRSRLGEWAIMPEADLEKDIETLQNQPPSQEKRERARILFSLILDTPGGLKIQTIHSFCQALLKCFPLEAEISPFFEVTNSTEQIKLIEAASCKAMNILQSSGTYQSLISEFHESKFDELNNFILQERESFSNQNESTVDELLGVRNLTQQTLISQLLQGIPESDLRESVKLLHQGSASDQERAGILSGFLILSKEEKVIEHQSYLSFFLTQTGTKRSRLATKKISLINPTFTDILEREATRLENWQETWRSLEIANISKAMLNYSHLFLKSYDTLKNEKSLLDYDDLILKTSKLLKNPGCHWVLYKLDGGLDHILVDEAQDTNPAQWQVIRAIAEEFYANASTDPRQRTLFIVGDEKQSIYSFQGADPVVFTQMQKDLKEFAQNSGQAWKDVDLNVSFRSTPEILNVVDATFHSSPLTSSNLEHLPFRKDAKGHVELWPLIKKEEKKTQSAWQFEITKAEKESPQRQLAKIISKTIHDWLSGRHYFSRPISPGDILVLVRRRTSFVDQLIRELKDNDVPVAGLDRLWLLEGIGVQDLLKIAEFLLLPTDDLVLATILKGPLFNISENDLFTLCHERNEKTLWEKLQSTKQFHPICETLRQLLNQVDNLTPFALFNLLLGPLDGRKKWQACLGPEVLDSLDEFLNLCLDFQNKCTPTLQGFLEWIHQETIELKRDLDQTNQVRIMTVHGSKGLQAPVVFLPDTTQPPIDIPSFDFYKDTLLWLPPANKDIELTKRIKNSIKQRQQEEYKRLLYVAMTRAEDALFVSGWETPYQNNWYQLIKEGIEKVGEKFNVLNFPEQEKGWRLSSLELQTLHQPNAPIKPTFLLPSWLKRTVAPETPLETIRPSASDSNETQTDSPSKLGSYGTQRGTHIHKLLEILPELPQDQRKKVSQTYFETCDLSETKREEIIRVVDNVMSTYPDLFVEASKAEVPLIGIIGNKVLSGKVDRIVFDNESILIIDYKTHKNIPPTLENIPTTYFLQLLIYKTALQEIYPSKEIQCGLLWTETPRLDIIPDSYLKKVSPVIDEVTGKPYTEENYLISEG